MTKMEYNKEKYENFMNEFDPELIIWKGTDWQFVKLKLSKIVHLLFWWQSWSWKSVFVLQLLFQILFLTNPDSLKLILIDPLKVSFKDFKELPHLLSPVWWEVIDATNAINEMMKINKERYWFLESVWFEDIYEYNEALLKNEIPYKDENWISTFVKLEQIPEKYIQKTKTENCIIWEPIPQIVAFFDEFNALMLNPEFWWKNPSEASTPQLKKLIWISEQARKAWIIIILGTQKISASTVPTSIRWNLKTRICLKVATWPASRTILWDTVENNSQWAKLVGYWDLLVYNENLNSSLALRWQSFLIYLTDMLDLVNWFIKTYGKNKFEYIKVNEEYAQNSEDLEPLPIDYDLYKIWLPELIIVKDNIFMNPKYTKLLSEIIRNPFDFEDKILSLRYPSIKKEFKEIKQRLIDVWILGMNKIEWEKEWYFWLNLKLKWLKYIIDKYWIIIEDKYSWDTSNIDYQCDLMKLLLIHLNKTYNVSAKNISYDISNYE